MFQKLGINCFTVFSILGEAILRHNQVIQLSTQFASTKFNSKNLDHIGLLQILLERELTQTTVRSSCANNVYRDISIEGMENE